MEGGKPEGPRKKLLECGWEPTTCTNNTNSTHCDARSRNWTWVTVVVGKPSHQCLWMRNYVTLRLGCAGLSIFSLVGIHSMGAGAALRKLTDIHVISTFSVLLFKCVVGFILFTSRHVLFICKMVLWKEPNFWNSVRKSPPPTPPFPQAAMLPLKHLVWSLKQGYTIMQWILPYSHLSQYGIFVGLFYITLAYVCKWEFPIISC